MDSATAIQSRRLGAVLVARRLITGEQLEQALHLQESTGAVLDEIVVSEFGVEQAELERVRAEDEGVPPAPAPAAPAAARLRRPIGEIFVELGFITSKQLEAALVVQRQTGARIGEILVEQGSLSRLDLASALAEHWEPRRPEPDDGPSLQYAPHPAAPVDLGRSVDDREALAELEQRLSLAVERVGDALATDARVSGAEAAVARIEGLESRVREAVDRDLAGHFEALAARLDRIEQGLDAATLLDERLTALGKDVAELRAELEGPGERLLDLSVRIDRTARDSHDRVTSLAEELRAEAARVRVEAEQAATALHAETGSLAARIDELLGLRHSDAQAARATTEQLEERFEEIFAQQVDLSESAAHGAVHAAETERSLHNELERIASLVDEFDRRLDEQAAIGDEQARAVERALRKGLADLGKRLIGSDAKYASRGKRLRRSIERLGAAVLEADARLAEQIPAAAAEGFVAFTPTAAGYRLVELPGSPPVIGSQVEIDGDQSKLVVTRYGRSPLPFDGRPCAYLDRG